MASTAQSPKKAKNQGRIVITLDFEIPESDVPAAQDGVDVVRERLFYHQHGRLIDNLVIGLEARSISITHSRLEVTK